MGIFSKFEDRMEDTVEGAASRMSKAPISPVQIAKKAEKQMRRETMVGAGKQYAPTLYTVLVNPDDDERLFGYYPTLAGETETYLSAKAAQEGLVMDGEPLVRFIVDEGLRHGKFDVIAELVAAPIVSQLREEEMERYGIAPRQRQGGYQDQQQGGYDQPRSDGYGYEGQPQRDMHGQGRQGVQQDAQPDLQRVDRKPPLPYVPEDEIDRSIDYGVYTFNSENFEDYRNGADNPHDVPMAYNDAFSSWDGDAAYESDADAGYDDGGYEYQQDFAAGAEGGFDDDYDQRYDQQQVQQQAYQQAQQQGEQELQQPEQQRYQAPNTAAFVGGAGASPVPDQRVVRARFIDLTFQRTYDLTGTRVTLGRETGNDIRVQDVNASRRHAELTLNAQGLWVITDMRSMNGTYVNGVSVASQPLYPGDIVTIGKSDFEFALA